MSEPIAVFPHVEGHWTAEETLLQRDLARIMIASVRRTMPTVPVKMLTDQNTPEIEGVDETLRKPIGGWAWIPWVCDFCAQLRGQVLYLDTDIVVQRDLRALFSVPADVLIPSRGPKMIEGRMMPFLFGCVAYRTAEFWLEVRDRVMAMTNKDDQAWWGSQIAVFEMWMEEQNGRGKWNIASVACSEYNYTPKDAEDAPADKWVLHYKGRKRKAWMRERWAHLLNEKLAA